jgi:hypothetical protein
MTKLHCPEKIRSRYVAGLKAPGDFHRLEKRTRVMSRYGLNVEVF